MRSVAGEFFQPSFSDRDQSRLCNAYENVCHKSDVKCVKDDVQVPCRKKMDPFDTPRLAEVHAVWPKPATGVILLTDPVPYDKDLIMNFKLRILI